MNVKKKLQKKPAALAKRKIKRYNKREGKRKESACVETEKSKIAPGRVILPAELRQPATRLATWLLGKTLCRRNGTEVLRFELTETDCYFGEADSACHAHRGSTPRTATLYLPGGVA